MKKITRKIFDQKAILKKTIGWLKFFIFFCFYFREVTRTHCLALQLDSPRYLTKKKNEKEIDEKLQPSKTIL